MISLQKHCPVNKHEFREALHISSERATYAVQEKDIAFTALNCHERCLIWMRNAAVKCLRLLRMSGLFRMNWLASVGGAESEGWKLRGLFSFVLFWPEIAEMKG